MEGQRIAVSGLVPQVCSQLLPEEESSAVIGSISRLEQTNGYLTA
jgi:hypothetical protein